jgi:hypothetical protein
MAYAVRPWGELAALAAVSQRPSGPVHAAVVRAAFGTLACSVYGGLLVWTTLHAQMDIKPWGNWLLTACYLPLVAWGPLLGAVTVHYHRRRTRG